jgi:hypothetical protein
MLRQRKARRRGGLSLSTNGHNPFRVIPGLDLRIKIVNEINGRVNVPVQPERDQDRFLDFVSSLSPPNGRALILPRS